MIPTHKTHGRLPHQGYDASGSSRVQIVWFAVRLAMVPAAVAAKTGWHRQWRQQTVFPARPSLEQRVKGMFLRGRAEIGWKLPLEFHFHVLFLSKHPAAPF